MSLERQDARCKLDPEDHAALHSIALDRIAGAKLLVSLTLHEGSVRDARGRAL